MKIVKIKVPNVSEPIKAAVLDTITTFQTNCYILYGQNRIFKATSYIKEGVHTPLLYDGIIIEYAIIPEYDFIV